MRKLLCLFCILWVSYVLADDSTSDTLIDLESDHAGFVHSVNVITGDYIDMNVDLVIPGPQPLVLKRSYHSSKHVSAQKMYQGDRHVKPTMLFHSWTIHQGGYAYFDNYKQLNSLESNGVNLAYREYVNPSYYTVNYDRFNDGITNTACGEISARTNLKNTFFSQKSVNHGKYWEQRKGNYELRLYRKVLNNTALLEFNRYPNGISFQYNYIDWENERRILLESIKVINDQKTQYGDMTFSYSIDDDKAKVKVTSSCKQKVEYKFKTINKFLLLNEVNSSHAIPQKFTYTNISTCMGSFKITRKQMGTSFLEIDYYQETANNFNLAERGRVSSLKVPVGANGSTVPIYTFSYHSNKDYEDTLINGITTVRDAYGNQKDYLYDSHSRLETIISYKHSHVHRMDKFYWGTRSNLSNLITKTVLDHEEKVLAGKHLIYDAVGNVTTKAFFGSLTGEKLSSIVVDKKGIPSLDLKETYTRGFEYTDDGLNLCKRDYDFRIEHVYEYYPLSSLLKWHYIKDHGVIKQRQYFEYDDLHALSREILDDGTVEGDISNTLGATERYEKVIINTRAIPVGLPGIITEFCEDLKLGQKKCMHRTENSYDAAGRITVQHHYFDDMSTEPCYSLSWVYDAHGNCLQETNAMGQKTVRIFDQNDNKLFEQGPQSDYAYHYTYDAMNRLLTEEIHYQDNVPVFPKKLVTHYSYDYLNRHASSTDWCGNTTHFVYDAFGNVIETHHPSCTNEEGESFTPISHVKYDIFNHPAQKTDPSGNVTSYFYNLRGQPCAIGYADGSMEYCRYSLDGCLQTKGERNGTIIQYENDYLKRVTKKSSYDKSSQHLTTTTATYNNFHLLSETDPAGQITYYDYEFGLLASKNNGNTKEIYLYDDQRRLIETRYFYGAGETDYVAERKTYDLLDHVIAEEKIDGAGVISFKAEYEYDLQGNRSIIKTYTSPETFSTQHITYNALKEPLTAMDEEGNSTHYSYHYNANELIKEICDANDNLHCQAYDAKGKLIREQRFNASHMPLQERHFYYDANGNPLSIIENVFLNYQLDSAIRTDFQHNSMNQLVTMIEAGDTPQRRVTHYQYNQFGEKTKIIKPNGCEICYAYDGLGRVMRYEDTLNTFSYHYTYDENSNVIAVWDDILQNGTTRSYDVNNRLLAENLANGLSMQYTYDGMGRLTAAILPDHSSEEYIYAGNHLNKVCRKREDQIAYTHYYEQYNLSGMLLRSRLIGNAGFRHFEYDLKHRPRYIKSEHWTESIPAGSFDKVGNLLFRSITDPQGTWNCEYAYDELYQLTSESGMISHAYLNDSLYNQREKDRDQHVYNSLNQLLDDGNFTFYYDQDGNLIRKTSKQGDDITEYFYDGMDRLIKVKKEGEEIFYTYDDLSRRLSKKIVKDGNSDNSRYLYHGQNEVGAYDDQGNCIEMRMLGLGQGAEISATIAIELRGKAYAPIHDSNGNIVMLLDSLTGQICENYRYSAFGEEIDVESPLNPWRYSSKRCDPETGFIYFGQRYYNPQTGRFVTSDPLGYDAGPNLYAYVLNNPLIHFDKYGLMGNDNDSVLTDISIAMWGNTFNIEDRLDRTVANWRDEIQNPHITWRNVEDRCLDGLSYTTDLSKYGKKTLPEGLGIGYINGVNNTYAECIKTALYISQLSGGYNIDVNYNATQKFLGDLKESYLNINNINTEPTKNLHETWDRHLRQSDTSTYLQYAHSQGAILVRNALCSYAPELRERIFVVAIAPGAYVLPKTCGDMIHYRAMPWRDLVPRLDSLGSTLLSADKIVDLKSHPNAPFHDHDIVSPTYEDRIEKHALNYLNSNGKGI